jgi:cytochrome c biogenesis protein CcdA/thiol-disulfide isomerase/thioredoxin
MFLLVVSFVAGILTVLAPCVLPLLPIIIGGSVSGVKRNPYVITASLALAIVIFTLALKFSTAFINIPPSVWSTVSGIILVLFGLITVFPGWWEKINLKLGLGAKSDTLLNESGKTNSWTRDILIGLSLGPVFSSCSPTYFLILATVLPQSFLLGTVYLISYAVGLSISLLLISLLGQRVVKKARFAANPKGWFKRGLGILFVLVGVFILTGLDKKLQTFLVETGYYNVSNIEVNLLNKTQSLDKNMPTSSVDQALSASKAGVKNFPRYHEIAKPAGFINSSPLTLKSLIGKKVILADFMTYSCINCIRTFPYLNAWYDKYKDQGLEIVGIHTPEFAFEHKIENVEEALKKFGIKFPVVLDNEYGTWNAYGNNYWPRKYLIDIDGYIVFDHAGEGKYDETEGKIQELLREKKIRDSEPATDVPSGMVTATGTAVGNVKSPETYFGSERNQYLQNGKSFSAGQQKLSTPKDTNPNALTLGGSWNFESEFAENESADAEISYHYFAPRVFFVASAPETIKVKILRDGKPLTTAIAGDDVYFENGNSYVNIHADRLYNLIQDTQDETDHTLMMIIEQPGLKAFTFTFG